MRMGKLFLLSLAMLSLSGCVKLTVAWADMKPKGVAASPPILADARADWREKILPTIRKQLERHVYGALPDASETIVISHKTIDEAAFGGKGVLEEYLLQANAEFGGVQNTTEQFYMDVVFPADASGPVPIILMQTFCPRWDTIPHEGVTRPDDAGGCSDGGAMSGLMNYVFGRYIATPPIETILAEGYGVATIFPGEMVPDSTEAGLAALKDLSKGHADDDTRWGAIAAWGWAFSRMVDVLEADPRFDKSAMITFGHSRYGKSALVAAAYDERIDGVLSHQSGTGGASLNQFKKGESVGAITKDYPHWFSAKYASYAGREEEMPIDQHHLLALIAPRPVLLGNARRDVWSDPNGAFKAAVGADPIYELFGVRGLDQENLKAFKPGADLSFWIRPGTHGVVEEDWPAFLEFLDAHFGRGES